MGILANTVYMDMGNYFYHEHTATQAELDGLTNYVNMKK